MINICGYIDIDIDISIGNVDLDAMGFIPGNNCSSTFQPLQTGEFRPEIPTEAYGVAGLSGVARANDPVAVGGGKDLMAGYDFDPGHIAQPYEGTLECREAGIMNQPAEDMCKALTESGGGACQSDAGSFRRQAESFRLFIFFQYRIDVRQCLLCLSHRACQQWLAARQ